MSEYLKNLQENVILIESFNRVKESPEKPITIDLTEAELIEEMKGVFENDEDYQEALVELSLGYSAQKLQDLVGMKTNLRYKISRFSGDKGSEAYVALTKKLEAIQDKIETFKDAAVKGGKEIAQDVGEKVKDAAGEIVDKAKDFAVENPGTLGAAAAAAAVIAAGVVAYKKYWSGAAKACKGKPDEGACKKQYKLKALQAKVATMERGNLKCKASKKPDKCKAALDRKIAEVKLKMRKHGGTE